MIGIGYDRFRTWQVQLAIGSGYIRLPYQMT